jgi:phage gpG-like protein
MSNPITFHVDTSQVMALLRRAELTARRPEAVARSMGTTLKSITEGTFSSKGSSWRPVYWPRKADGSVSTLRGETKLLSSSFFLRVSGANAAIGNPTVYAAIHQFGSKMWNKGFLTRAQRDPPSKGADRTIIRKGIPPRPFFPITPAGQLTPRALDRVLRAGERALLRQLT